MARAPPREWLVVVTLHSGSPPAHIDTTTRICSSTDLRPHGSCWGLARHVAAELADVVGKPWCRHWAAFATGPEKHAQTTPRRQHRDGVTCSAVRG